MDFKQMVREGYNRIAARYLAERGREGEDVRLLDEFTRRLPDGARLLDAGCGAGEPVTRLLAGRFDVTGVDIAEAQIELARQLVPSAHFICADMTTLDFPDETFDGICSYYAIIHVPRREHPAQLANFHRMLKPSGLALLCLGAEDLDDDLEEYLETTMYWSHYDAETYLKLLTDIGFTSLFHRLIQDGSDPQAKHLFVLVQKKTA